MSEKITKKGIAFAGNLIVDRIKFIEAWPECGSLTTIREQTFSLGGLACNCSIDLAKLDATVPVKVIGIVGEDELGDMITGEFARYPSINTDHILRIGENAYTDVMTTQDGVRTFFVFMGSNAELSPKHFDFNTIQCDILHIGYILLLDSLDAHDNEYGTALCRVLADARMHGILTSIDVVSEEGNRFTDIVTPALKYTDYCVINDIEAAKTTGIPLRSGPRLIRENLEPCVRRLMEMGVGKWAVIHMPECAVGMDRETNRIFQKETAALPKGFIVSSVGAGDAFTTGMLLGVYNHKTLEESMMDAILIAEKSLSGKGASDAIVPIDEIRNEMRVYHHNLERKSS
jgi:sugar/nucleoside kinase (ribokinase family)